MVYVVCLDIFNYSRILIFFKISYPKNNIVITLVWNFIIYPLHICTFTSIPHHLKKQQFSVKNIQDQRFKMDKTFFFFGKKKFSINLFPLKILLLLPNHNSQLSISTISIYRVPISVLLWPNLLHLRYNKHISLIIITFILNIFLVCVQKLHLKICQFLLQFICHNINKDKKQYLEIVIHTVQLYNN